MNSGINFFIVGLPRTRLGWLANYFSYRDMFCHFDGTKNGLEFLDQPHKFKTLGNADHNAVLFQDQLIAKFPEAKWIIIERPFQEVLRSVKNLGVDPGNRLSGLSIKLDELRAKVNPMVVPFEQINERLYDMGKYIDQDWSCPSIRTSMLQEMNIQMDVELGKKQLASVDPKLQTKVESPQWTEANKALHKLLQEMCVNDPLALRWIVQVVSAALTLDHIIDQDAVDLEATNQVFSDLMTEWPVNNFLVTHAKSLMPVLSTALVAWRASYLNGAPKTLAYEVYADIPIAVAYILGGQANADYYGTRIRKLVQKLCEEDQIRDGGRL